MLPARFLRPWEVLEMDIQDMHQLSSAGNRYLLVVMDKASKFLFGFPLHTFERGGRGEQETDGAHVDFRCTR